MQPNKRAVIVGLFIFIGILVFMASILSVGNLHSTFVKKIGVTVLFDDVNGLQAGNNIWFSGVKIGTVKKLNFYGESQVKVQMKIDEKAQQYIRKDAKVKMTEPYLVSHTVRDKNSSNTHELVAETGSGNYVTACQRMMQPISQAALIGSSSCEVPGTRAP